VQIVRNMRLLSWDVCFVVLHIIPRRFLSIITHRLTIVMGCVIMMTANEYNALLTGGYDAKINHHHRWRADRTGRRVLRCQ
jgi:hypothetical protein